MPEKYLIVEGYYDYLFYKSLFEKLSIKDIKVTKPQDTGISYGGKGNAIKFLGTLASQFRDGRADKILIILDADFNNISNEGFYKTLYQIRDELSGYNYDIFTQPCKYTDGIILRSSKGYPDVAVWIMPDNSGEGYLESLLIEVIDSSVAACMREATEICTGLRNRRFPEHHYHKAVLAIFMAMQDNPGRNITHLIENGYINFSNVKIRRLVDFIKNYYQ